MEATKAKKRGPKGPHMSDEKRLALGYEVINWIGMGSTYKIINQQTGHGYSVIKACHRLAISHMQAKEIEKKTVATRYSAVLGVNGSTTLIEPLERIEIPNIKPAPIAAPIRIELPEVRNLLDKKVLIQTLASIVVSHPEQAEYIRDIIQTVEKL